MDNFKGLIFKRRRPDEGLLVPLLMWCSGKEDNIENMQSINRKFFQVDKSILVSQLTLTNNLHHFIKFPKRKKKDDKINFFYENLAQMLNYSMRELWLTMSIEQADTFREEVATKYGYDNKQRRALKLGKIKCLV